MIKRYEIEAIHGGIPVIVPVFDGPWVKWDDVLELIQDAERYRWLERGGLLGLPYDDHGIGPEYDLSRGAIDAAMRPNT